MKEHWLVIGKADSFTAILANLLIQGLIICYLMACLKQSLIPK
jgi:hypothetical protein